MESIAEGNLCVVAEQNNGADVRIRGVLEGISFNEVFRERLCRLVDHVVRWLSANVRDKSEQWLIGTIALWRRQ
jgi:hypothetical protein